MNIREEWVYITGAAGGLGSAMAEEFASHGANLVLTDLSKDSLSELTQRLLAKRVEVLCYEQDVTDRKRWTAIAADLDAHGKIPRVLVNNAGIAAAGNVLDLSDDSWEQVLDVDLWGVIHGCREFVPRMLEEPGQSAVLNVSSCAAFLGLPMGSAYSIAKAGVLRLTESLQTEVSPQNVSFTCLCPGAVFTGIWASAAKLGTALPATMDRITGASKPGQRDPSQVARKAVRGLLAGKSVVKVYPEAWLLDLSTRLIPADTLAKAKRWLHRRTFPEGK